ncbi:hypothetical protein BGZ70_001042 [Mortierella alpina]|uniref:Uncharacterized protein n=1 Tax=Mortierella alpina TaxID=64518 RepID=A0A9P6LY54_MORAP|nr:hypothetical protein BGZ70_001042 [Mortierella alpina]
MMQHTDQRTGASEAIVNTPTKQQPLEQPDTVKNSNDDGAVHGQPDLQSNTSPSTLAKITTPLPSINRTDLDAAGPSPLGTPVPYDSDNIEPKDDRNNNTLTAPTADATHGRRPSLTDTVLATAATAATSAASAASTVVSAALKFVATDDHDDSETADTATTGAGGVGTGILPVLLRSSQDDHQGLEFSQRRLSVDPSKKAPSELCNSVTGKQGFGETDTSVVADSILNELGKNTSDLKISSVEPVSTGVGTTAAVLPANSATVTSNGSPSTPLTVTDAPLEAKTNADHGLKSPDKALSTEQVGARVTNASGNSDNKEGNADGRKDETVGSKKPTSAAPPVSTMYVTGHGPESARHQGLNVDHPAVSHTSASKTNHSGLGVDKPKVVGEPRDLNFHRTGSLHVDKHPAAHPHDHHEIHVPHHDHDASVAAEGDHHGAPIQTSRDNSKVIHGNEHHLTQNTSAEAKAAIAKNPFEAHMSHHRGSASSGLGVDHPVIPTANLAGSGSSDNTNRNRPHGTYNSAINVDKAGSPDHKRSGMNVDGPAAAVHHLATVKDPLSKSTKSKVRTEGGGKVLDPKVNNTTSNVRTEADGVSASTSTSSKHYPDDDRESVLDKVKNVFRRSSVNTMSSKESSSSNNKNRGSVASESANNGITVQSNNASSHPTVTKTSSRSSFPEQTVHAPAEYNGPVPETAPGEEVVWVKRVVQTDYYDGDEDQAGASVENHKNRRPHRSLLDRLRGRHPAPPVDKGKQRVQDF